VSVAEQIVDELVVDPTRARVYEHGWQSWSPSTHYSVEATSHRPARPVAQAMCYRPGRPAPPHGFQGEGLLAVDLGDGSAVRVYAAADGTVEVPSVRGCLTDRRLTVTADGPVELLTGPAAPASSLTPFAPALAAWADRYALRAGVRPLRAAPTVWCSWYHYRGRVGGADIDENLAAIGERGLPVDVVQVDDGWQRAVGDWLEPADRFAPLPAVVDRVRAAGRRAGIWVAPFTVAADSAAAVEHPDWLVRDAAGAPVDAGYNWGAPLYGLDLTHPGVRGYLAEVFERLRGYGFDYFKIDFCYAGALDGARRDGSAPLAAYRSGLSLVREAIGPHAYLLGCGVPILPTVGLVDAARVATDVAASYRPRDGDPAQPSQFGAALSTIGRAFQHGRFWVNDPDCILAGPGVERREEWAQVVERYGGLRGSSDRVAELDDWGLRTTVRLLRDVPPPTPFAG
jgi:alpha-galactosidase